MNIGLKNNYVPFSILIAIIYWVGDSIIEWHVHTDEVLEFIPSDMYELWLKILVFILIVSFGIYTNYLTKKLVAKEEEKKKIYKDTANEARKVLKEFLHDVHYFESEAERIGGFDGNTMKHLENALKNTQERLEKLENIGDLTARNMKINPDK